MNEQLKKAFNSAINYLSRSMKSEEEIRKYLQRHMYSEDIINECLKMLNDYNYIDDDEYCKCYIVSALDKLRSKKQIYYGLVKKGINKELINKYIENINEAEIIKKIVTKKSVSYKENTKLISYLLHKGFDYEEIRKVIDVSDSMA